MQVEAFGIWLIEKIVPLKMVYFLSKVKVLICLEEYLFLTKENY